MDNLTFNDFLEAKDKRAVTPEVWSCMESCAIFTNKYPDGSREKFPVTGEPRCIHAISGATIAWESEVIDNVWHTWCKLYRPKER